MEASGDLGVEAGPRQGTRWVRALGRIVFFGIGGVQCLLGVMFGVALIAAAFFYVGEGPGSVASDLLFFAVDLVLLGVGLITVLSALEEWDPPDDRWRGIRWPVLGLAGTAITVVSWIVIGTAIW